MNTLRLWLARLLLVCATLGVAASVQAAPIDYTMTFVKTGGNGPLPTAGFFTYDADAPLFTNFHILWNGTDYNMTGSANTATYPGVCGGGGSGAAIGFAILSGAIPCPSNQLWQGAALADAVSFFELFASVEAFDPNVGQMTISAVIRLFESGPNDGAVENGVGGTFQVAPAITAVPEPASMTLLASGLAGVWLRRRRRG